MRACRPAHTLHLPLRPLLSYAIADYAASTALEAHKWHLSEYQAFLADTSACSAAALADFAASRLWADGVELDVLVHGNCDERRARELAASVRAALLAPPPAGAGGVPLTPSRVPSARCVALPVGAGGVRLLSASGNEDEPNAAVDLSLQVRRPHPPRRPRPPRAVQRRSPRRARALPRCPKAPTRPQPQHAPSLPSTLPLAPPSLQIGPSEPKSDVLLALVAAVLEPRLFAQLRTAEQLGYLVATATRCVHGVRALRIVVQSKAAAAEQLEARIEVRRAVPRAPSRSKPLTLHPPLLPPRAPQAFLARFGEGVLDALPPAEFERYRASAIEGRLERDKAMAEETGRDWAEIAAATFHFGRLQGEVAALRGLEQAELGAFWREYCAPGAPRRRKLLVAVAPGARAQPPPAPLALPADAPPPVDVPAAEHVLRSHEEVLSFKRAMGLFPSPARLLAPSPADGEPAALAGGAPASA